MKNIFRRRAAGALAFLMLAMTGCAGDKATPAAKYDPERQGILSGYYAVEEGLLLGVAPGTSAAFLQGVCLPQGLSLSRDPAATGATLSLPGNTKVPALTVAVTGDLDGDGRLTEADAAALRAHLETPTLTGAALAAADVDRDGLVDGADALALEKALETGLLPAPRSGMDGSLVLTPGASAPWQTPAALGNIASYISDNTAVAAVDAAGTVTAKALGATCIYALDAAGAVVCWAAVTVVQTPQALTCDVTELTLAPGTDARVTLAAAHPVYTPISVQSTDTAVATATSTGHITALAPGSATLTFSLPDGAAAQVAVTVLSPIDSLAFQRPLHKLKPGATRTLALTLGPQGGTDEFTWSVSDPAVATVDEAGTVTALEYGTATVTVTGRHSGLTAQCTLKVCDAKTVALTFDDGPSLYTPELLDYLQEKGIHVTFFVVANRIPEHEEIVKRAVAEGHEMGYHSYGHRYQTELSDETIQADLEKSNQLLRDLTGAEFTVWRAPGGKTNARVLAAIPLPHIRWSVDPRDWAVKNAQSVRYSILDQSRDGSIILLHDLYPTSVAGAKLAVDEMLAGDYEFVTVSELLAMDGTPAQPGTTYFSADNPGT